MNPMRPALAGAVIVLLAAAGWQAGAARPWPQAFATGREPVKAGARETAQPESRLGPAGAVSAARRVLPVKGFRVQGVSLIQQWEGLADPVYNIVWSSAAGAVQAPCAVAAVSARTGQVLQYVSFASPQGRGGASGPARGMALDWAKRLAGARFSQFSGAPVVSPPVQGVQTFTFFRTVGGVPVAFDSIQVSIGASGQMESYQFFWRPDALPARGAGISRSAAERNWVRAVGLRLAYVAAQGGKGGAVLAYVPRLSPDFARGPWTPAAYGAPWINAATGAVLNPAGQAPDTSLPASGPVRSRPGGRLGSVHSGSPEAGNPETGNPEAGTPETGKGEPVGSTASGEPEFPPPRRALLTAGQCAALARGALGLPPSAAAGDFLRSLWGPDAFGKVETVWTLALSSAQGPVHVAVDARTGLILYVGRPGAPNASAGGAAPSSGGAAPSPVRNPAVLGSRLSSPRSESESIDSASDFVARVLPGLSGSFVPTEVRPSAGGAGGSGLTVNYTLFARGVPAEFDRLSVTVNRTTGQVVYYFASLAAPGAFPPVSGTISPRLAASVYVRNFPLALAYVLPPAAAGGQAADAGNPRAALAYVPIPKTGAYELDAKTGAWIAASNFSGQ